MRFALLALLLVLSVPGIAPAQVRDTTWRPDPVPVVPLPQVGAPTESQPWARTSASIAGSAAAFLVAHSFETDPDRLIVPILASVAGGAAGGLLFTNARPLQVLAGSALAALPAGALAAFFAGRTPDDDQGLLPVLVFSIPHGLLTSAFAQQR